MIKYGIALSEKSIQIIDFDGRIIYDKSVDSTVPLFKRVICVPDRMQGLLYRIFKEFISLPKRLFIKKQIFVTVNPRDGELERRITKSVIQSMRWRYSPILVPFPLATLIGLGLDSNHTGQKIIIDIDDKSCFISFFSGMDLLKFEETELEINAIIGAVNSIIKNQKDIDLCNTWILGHNENLNDFYTALNNSLSLSIKLSLNPQSVTINGLNKIMKCPESYLSKYL